MRTGSLFILGLYTGCNKSFSPLVLPRACRVYLFFALNITKRMQSTICFFFYVSLAIWKLIFELFLFLLKWPAYAEVAD